MKPLIKLYTKKKNDLLDKRITNDLCFGILIGFGITVTAILLIMIILKFLD